MVVKNLNYYASKFTKLRVDRAHRAVAPHKPILALSRDACNFLQDGLKVPILSGLENLLHQRQASRYL